jgi:hypothetical protein
MWRVTVELDSDVNALLRAEMKRTGETLSQIVNRILRLGFEKMGSSVQERSEASLRRRSK